MAEGITIRIEEPDVGKGGAPVEPQAPEAAERVAAATERAATSTQSWLGTLQQASQTFGSFGGNVISGFINQAGQLLGGVERAKHLLGVKESQVVSQQPAGEAQTVQPASMTEVMSAHAKGGIPVGAGTSTVQPASMTDIMSASQKPGGIPVGTAEAAGEAEAAEAAGGLAAGAMSGGIALAAVMMEKAVDKAMTKVGDAFRDTGRMAQGGADIVGAGARGENAEAIGKVYSGFVKMSEKVPLVGEQMALLAGTAGSVVGAFHDVVTSFIDRGRELSQFSGQLGASYAIGDVKQILADIREANKLESGLSRMNDAWVELTLMLREILLPLKQAIVEKIADILERIVQKVKDNEDTLVRMTVLLENMPSIIKGILTGGLAGMTPEELKKKIDQALTDAANRRDEEMGPLNEWLNMPRDRTKVNPAGNILALQRRMNIPVFGGA
jgi:hypothetical protein